jgi:Cu/Ag efflux protein CusF
MKKMACGLGLASALALMAGQARAQNAPQGGRAGGAESPTSSTSSHFDALTGKVQQFDRSTNELTVAGSDQKLKIDSSTKVMRDGSRASIDDIKEGDQVRASYSDSGDTLQVKSLDITSPGAMGGSSGERKPKSVPHGGSNAPSGNSGEIDTSGSKIY